MAAVKRSCELSNSVAATRPGQFSSVLARKMRLERYAKSFFVLTLFSCAACLNVSSENHFNDSLSKTKRETNSQYKYLIFPQGSNVQLIYCLTIGTLTKPEGLFTIGVTAGLAYELPHKASLRHRKPAEVYHRRSRRDLYRKLERMFEAQGKDGRGCVLKALCQAGKRDRDFSLEAKSRPFLDEILHSIFSFRSLSNGSTVEPLELEYDEAYNAQDDCDKLYLSCSQIF